MIASTLAIVTGQPAGWLGADQDTGALRVTMFDVGQGDATLLQLPDRSGLLVDAGGIPFGSTGFDIGSRVLSPALWARGVRSLDTLLLTHGDPDHIGGARAMIADFGPAALWEGVPVVRHRSLQDVLRAARDAGLAVAQRQSGEEWRSGRCARPCAASAAA